MRMIWVGIGALATASAALAGQAQRAPGPSRVPETPIVAQGARVVLPATQALFAGYVAQKKMPGIVGMFGLGRLPTQTVAAGTIADGSPTPVDADTLWRVYSMTKPITGMAAMMLVEDGKLNLDDPVAKYIPAFKSMRVLTSPDTSLDSRPAKTPITIRNLLTHTAGLGYSINAKGPILKEYERLGILPAAINAQTEVQMRAVRSKTLEEFANRVASVPLVAEPGTTWHYSIGLDVMGRVIEVASGMPFERFVQTRLFGPLKMNSSYWQVPASELGRLATNYAFVGENRVPFDPAATSVFAQKPSFPYGGAGLVMSARDYDRFLHMLQDGGTLEGVQVMKPETVALAMSNLLPAGVSFRGVDGDTGGTNAPATMGFGAGGSVTLVDTPGGPAKGTYGWGGAAGTYAWVDPARKARGVVMVNYFPATKWPIRAETGRAIMADVARFRR